MLSLLEIPAGPLGKQGTSWNYCNSGLHTQAAQGGTRLAILCCRLYKCQKKKVSFLVSIKLNACKNTAARGSNLYTKPHTRRKASTAVDLGRLCPRAVGLTPPEHVLHPGHIAHVRDIRAGSIHRLRVVPAKVQLVRHLWIKHAGLTAIHRELIRMYPNQTEVFWLPKK